MKKLLVASTALVAVAAVSTAHADGHAGGPIKINVGGYMNQHVGFTDQDEDGQEKFASVLVQSEVELYFRGSTKLDNGLTVGVNVDLYTAQDNQGVDDVFLNISGDNLGTIRLGQTKGAAYALSHVAPSAGAVQVNDGDVETWINDTVVTSNQTHTASEANDGQKIVYWTPNFSGFQAGISYGLDTNNNAETTVDVGGANTGSDTAVEGGIAYNGEVSGVSVGADVTFMKHFNGGTTGTGVEDENGIRAGLSVSTAGFTVGGSYRDTSNENDVQDQDSSAWDAGVSYATGPYTVSFTYAHFDQEDSGAANAQEDTADMWAIGGSYSLGAGVTLVGSVFAAEFDDASVTANNATQDNEGYGVVAGLNVSF